MACTSIDHAGHDCGTFRITPLMSKKDDSSPIGYRTRDGMAGRLKMQEKANDGAVADPERLSRGGRNPWRVHEA